MRERDLEREPLGRDRAVPLAHGALAVGDVLVAQHLVERVAQADLLAGQLAVLEHVDRVDALERGVVLILVLLVATLEARSEEVRRVVRDLAAEELDRAGEPEVDVLLDRRQIDAALPARVAVRVLLGQARALLQHAVDARLTDEEVERLLGQHEARRAGERIEAGLGQGRELVLAVTVGEHREAEEREPVAGLLVERRQDARRVGVARAPREQLLGLLAAVAAEELVEQVDHRPQVAALLDVDLEQVAQIVERGRALAELALLLDARRLGVGLRDDDPAQDVAQLAGDLVPHRRALRVAEADRAVLLGRREEDAPAVVGHLHVVVVRPAGRIDRDGRAQVDLVLLEARGPHLAPPVDEVRLPRLERALQTLVRGEVDVVRDLVVEAHGALQSFGVSVSVSSGGNRTRGGSAFRTARARRSRRRRWGAGRSSSARR